MSRLVEASWHCMLLFCLGDGGLEVHCHGLGQTFPVALHHCLHIRFSWNNPNGALAL